MEAEGVDRTFVPAVDGTTLPIRPGRAIREGSAAGIPHAHRHERRRVEAAGRPPTPTAATSTRTACARASAASFAADALDGLIEAVRDARSARGESSAPNDVFYAIESERVFRVPSACVADLQVEHAPTFVYLFGWGSPAMRGWLGACHGLEIAFVFGNQGRGELAAFTGSGPEADALAERMMDAWLAFTRTGDPSTPRLPWPRHDPATRPTIVFDAVTDVQHAPRDAERAVIDALMARPADVDAAQR